MSVMCEKVGALYSDYSVKSFVSEHFVTLC